MKKSILFILLFFTLFSCNSEDDVSKERCIDSAIPCPVIIGQENEGCVANIIFLAEGFIESEMTEFNTLCDVAKQAILDMEPFASASKNLNFYRVNAPSITSGIKTIQFTSVCNNNDVNNTSSTTPWSVFGNRVGLQHYAGMEPVKRDLLEELFSSYATGDYVYTIIIANTTDYYGGAEFPGVTEHNSIINPKVSNMIVSKYDGSEGFKYLIRHEFGHSFGNMDDEYEGSATLCAIENYEPWYLPQEPKQNVLTYNPGNWFEGARYVSKGYWREWENSIMRSDQSATTFAPKQREIVNQRLINAIGCN
ncbi:M64 family metallopeptidase [Namhaeicola litoreus]|uniref:M64 family metallopeptidase n=1 Tax=Namhaeicola litoreus TaxID=1052145 RepID=A0ABW3Y007_9FLAO